ncbi:hypothetical protein Acr_29g0005630 [Actinidia rufa]|uniref:NB-ARC domain-containing disease resistance protein n=1 Tax=Actinidia rufa TaxID=165716 RepID=A0A7J0HEK8_9ERIC|nr:hypothetical protein Acr_29g0005630 [Actinidia rufa]
MEGSLPPPPSLVANSFTNLTVLILNHCPMIRNVFSSRFMIQQLSNLKLLDIISCSGLEGMLSEDENVEYEALPKLMLVQLLDLPEFVSFFKGVAMCWKSLERVQISKCPKLRNLPLDVNSAANLKQIQASSRNWLDALEWNNNATKLRLEPLVLLGGHFSCDSPQVILPDPEVWEMFYSEVGDIAMFPTMKQHAKEIVRKCGGLPLAPKVVNNKIKKSQWIGYWRAEGLLSGNLTLADAHVKGDAILQALVDASLLERCDGDDINYVKMHDVVQDLALAMTSHRGDDAHTW